MLAWAAGRPVQVDMTAWLEDVAVIAEARMDDLLDAGDEARATVYASAHVEIELDLLQLQGYPSRRRLV